MIGLVQPQAISENTKPVVELDVRNSSTCRNACSISMGTSSSLPPSPSGLVFSILESNLILIFYFIFACQDIWMTLPPPPHFPLSKPMLRACNRPPYVGRW